MARKSSRRTRPTISPSIVEPRETIDAPVSESPVVPAMDIPVLPRNARLCHEENFPFFREEDPYIYRPASGFEAKMVGVAAITMFLWGVATASGGMVVLAVGLAIATAVAHWFLRHAASPVKELADPTTDRILVGKITKIMKGRRGYVDPDRLLSDTVTWVYQFTTPTQRTITGTVTREVPARKLQDTPGVEDKAYVYYRDEKEYWLL